MRSILCPFCQWIAARCLDDGTRPSGWAARHLAGCPNCQARHERDQGIADRLAVKPGDAPLEMPAFLHERILANLDSRRSSSESAPVFRVAAWTGAILGGAAVLVLVTLLLRNESMRSPAPVAGQEMDRTGRSLFAGLPRLSGEQAMLVLSTSLDAPLEGELRFVMEDARTALNALSRNFLPAEESGAPR